jgi:exodeoxyribonuclease VII small subunit
MAETDEKSFEETLRELEGIVTALENGELSLEDSLSTFERGVKLVRTLHEKLAEAEKKVQILIKDREGVFRLEPWKEDEIENPK